MIKELTVEEINALIPVLHEGIKVLGINVFVEDRAVLISTALRKMQLQAQEIQKNSEEEVDIS